MKKITITFLIIFIYLLLTCSLIPRFNTSDTESDDFALIPDNLYASNGDYDRQIEIIWDAMSFTKLYKIYRSADSADNTADYEEIGTAVINSFFDISEDLAAETTYYYRVKAILNNDRETNFSESVSGYRSSGVSKKVPSPWVFVPEVTTTLRPSWGWEKSPQVIQYRSRFIESVDWLGTIDTADTTADAITFTPAADLTANSYHMLVVEAQDANGDWSAPGEAMTYITDKVPTLVTASFAQASDRIYLQWDETPFAERYRVYRSLTDVDAAYQSIGVTISTNYMDMDINLDYFTNYYYKITALFSQGTESSKSDSTTGAIKYGWKTGYSPLPTSRTNVVAQAYNGKIYVIGGTIGTAPTGLIEVYDTLLNSWNTPLTTMLSARYLAASIINNNMIYVIGGYDSNPDYSEACEVYNIDNDSWTALTSMIAARTNVSACLVNNKIYVLGGSDGGAYKFKKNEVYDIQNNNWAAAADMPIGRTDFTTCAVDGIIYAIGGELDGYVITNIVQAYNPSTNSWTTKTGMNFIRKGLSSIVYNNKIYVFGGVDSSGPLSTVEVYDPATDTWTTDVSAMPRSKAYHRSALASNKIYIISGSTNTTLVDALDLKFEGLME